MRTGEWIHGNLRRIEKMIYLISAGMLSTAVVVVFGQAVYEFYHFLVQNLISEAVIGLLESVLLALMLVELLHTLMVSIKSEGLLPEPFLIVALVAAVRRILAISVEGSHLIDTNPDRFKLVLLEISVLTGLILILVISIHILRKKTGGRAKVKLGPVTAD